MLTLRTTHAILVLCCVLLTLAVASLDPVNVMLAVASTVLAGQLVAQANASSPRSRRARR